MALFDADHWREILAALAANKLRTALTAFGVFWGIFMLMVMLGAGNGLSNGVMSDFAGQATNSFFVWSRQTSKPYRGLPAVRNVPLTVEDWQALREQVADVGIVAPRNQLGGYQGGNNVTRGARAGGFQVMGDVPEYRDIESVRLISGRFLDPLDMLEGRKVAVIGTRVRDVLYEPGEDPVGTHLRINGVYFKVIGVFRPGRDGESGAQQTETIHVPFATFQRAFNSGNTVGWFAVTSRDGVAASVVETRVLEVLRKRHRVAPDDERALGHWNTEEQVNKVRGLFDGIRALIWIVGIGTLTAGVIGVSNIMLVIVKERTGEIGVRRAVGATPLAITTQIVLESILLTGVAGYFGLLSGVALIDLVARMLRGAGADGATFARPEVAFQAALLSLAILIVAGALAGLIPAHRASRINTVEALRSV